MVQRTFSATSTICLVSLACIVFVVNVTDNWGDAGQSRRIHEQEAAVVAYKPTPPRNPNPKSTVILGIFSSMDSMDSMDGKDQRRGIRDTYLSTNDKAVCALADFVSGAKPECRVAYTFVVGVDETEKPLPDMEKPFWWFKEEAPAMLVPSPPTDEIDVIYLGTRTNVEEGKTISMIWLKYAAMVNEGIAKTRDNQYIDYVAKADTHVLLAPRMMLDFMDINLPPAPYNRGIYGGIPSIKPPSNPVYMTGGFYMMSIDVAKYAGITLPDEGKFKLVSKGTNMMQEYLEDEDYAVGVVVSSNPWPIKYTNLSNYNFWKRSNNLRNFRRDWARGQFDRPNKLEERTDITPSKFFLGNSVCKLTTNFDEILEKMKVA